MARQNKLFSADAIAKLASELEQRVSALREAERKLRKKGAGKLVSAAFHRSVDKGLVGIDEFVQDVTTKVEQNNLHDLALPDETYGGG